MEKVKLFKLDELLSLEKASRLVCMKYESASKAYDGSIINNGEYASFQKNNNYHEMILSELEKYLDKELGNV